MSSRRGAVGNEYDQGTVRFNPPRSWREPNRGNRNQSQGIRQPQYRPEQLQENDIAERQQIPQTRLGRAQAIVANIFQDMDDSGYVRRNNNMNQLLSIVMEKTPIKGDTAMWISENLQLMDLFFHGYANYPGLDSVFDDPKASATFKTSTIKLFSAIAECVRADLFAEWIFERLLFSTSSALPEKERERYKERSICLLDTLHQVVQNSMSNPMLHRQLATITPYILNNLMTVLDTVSSSEQIPSILKILLAISAGYPQLIDASFQDVVDLLMGWHTDPSVSASVHSAIEEFYYSMRNFWSTRIAFAFDLLRHLIIDIATSKDSLISTAVSNKDKQEAMKAIKAYFSCFHSIVRSISSFIAAQNDAISLGIGPAFDEVRSSMMESIWQLSDVSMPSEWLKKSNAIMLELAQTRKTTFQPMQWTMYTMINKQKDQQAPQETLETLFQAFKTWTPNVDQHIIEDLLDPEVSPVIQLYFHDAHAKTRSAAQAFLRILLLHCQDTLLQEKLTARYFAELASNTSRLQQHLCSGKQSDEVLSQQATDSGHDDLKYMLRSSFDSQKVANIQKCLAFYTHLSLAVSLSWPQRHQPCVESAIATIQSVWDCNCETVATELLGIVREFYVRHVQNYFMRQEEKKHFEQMCDLLACAVGRWSYLSSKAKRLVASWIKDAVLAAETYQHAQSTLDSVLVTLFLAQDSEENTVVFKMVLSILNDIRRLQLSTRIIGSIFPVLERSLHDPSEEISSLASAILTRITPWLAVCKISKLKSYQHKIQKKILASPHTGNFRPAHFEQAMRFLTMDEYLPKMDQSLTTDLIQDWCQRLFHHCETTISIQDTANLAHLTDGDVSLLNKNEDLLLYWVIWEAARYCMLSRMRTPCGGPQQTFSALERTLDKLLAKTTSQNDNENLVPLRYLVLLIDRLELQIFNASAGNATGALPSAPRSSIIFFRANRKTCRDWFAHIRGKMIASARLLCDDHMIVRQSWEALSEKEQHLRLSSVAEIPDIISDMDQVIAVSVESLIRLQAVEVIDGLQKWHQSLGDFMTKKTGSGNSDRKASGLLSSSELQKKWFYIAGMFTQGFVEPAINEYRACRGTFVDSKCHSDMMLTLDNQVVNYLTGIEDYASFNNWIGGQKQDIDIFGIDILNDMFRAFASGSKSTVAMHSQLSTSSLEIWIEHMNVQQCIYFSRLKQFQKYAISAIAGSSSQKAIELWQLVRRLLSTKFLAAVQVDSYLKWSAQTEMSLMELRDCDQEIALSSWVCQYQYRFKRSDLDETYRDSTHWARMGHYLCNINAAGMEQNAESWIKASVIFARVCRWKRNFKTADLIISKVLAQYPACQQALFEKAKALEKSQDYTAAAGIYGQVVRSSTDHNLADEMKARANIAMTKLCKRRHWQAACALLQEFDSTIHCQNESDYSSAITRLYESASNLAPDWPKVWFLYGTHCYRYGWQLLEDIKSRRGATMVTQEVLQIAQNALYAESGSKQATKDVATICSIFTHGSQCWNLDDESKSRHFEENIQTAFPHLPESSLNSLTLGFKQLQLAIITSFRSAIGAYRQYLKLGRLKQNNTYSAPSMNITCTLRLLRLLVKYGTCLQEQFRNLIEQDDITSWKLIIPQLFSRLNQPSSYARDIIWEILAKIARESPKNVMYELIVGCNSPKTSSETKQLLQRMASQLSATDYELMGNVKKMIEEMEKITVLWEEKWINKIAMLQFDATDRLQRFEKELSRMKVGSSNDVDHGSKALSDIYDAILMPVVVSIRELIKETIDSGSDTPHEQWFQKAFGGSIRQAFSSFKKPKSWKTYRQGWDCFQKLHRELMKETNKLRILKLSQLSPYLAQIKGTDIPMPGVQDDEQACTIDSFVEDIIILPTKTRPKKVDLKGSDNKIYPFLFKGLEDLHLDERIMQLMSTINDLMKGDMHRCEAGMRARNFAVIPISDHSGMIQWVQDATPLFALYKRWQQRENAAMVMTAEKQASDKPPAVIQRPTEIFMEKISSALKREGLPVTASRRKWPKEVLKNVFLELQNETPNDLLSKEVWCNSTTAQDWWQKASSLARSMAVMSVIGYIIGLGDRHLDNTMVDFGSGEIVHIDFNVCFEKGKRLRVPELVPFRLTQNMVHALGITGPDGLFKITAEQVLSVLQRHKEVLVTLLDAFVYDPLFDWSTEVEENQKKQMMDLQANFGLLSNRLDEVKQQLNDEERVIMDLLESLCVQLETDQEVEESTNTSSVQQDLDDTSNEVNYAVEDLKQILVDVFPLLESIDIMQVEVDNELKIGQQNVKIILASIAKLEESIPALITSSMAEEADTKAGQQRKEKRIEECMLVMITVKELFGAIKALEGYGTDVKGQNDVQMVTNALQQLTLVKTSDEQPSDEVSPPVDPHVLFAGDGKLSDFDVAEGIDEETNTEASSLQPTEPAKSDQDLICADTATRTERRNHHAVAILRRIRSKLEGVDFGHSQPYSVPEHISAIISEAQSIDNLSLMYEGWTSWV